MAWNRNEEGSAAARSYWRRLSIGLLALGVAIATSVVVVRAVHDTGAFELDGNAQASGTNGPPDDWDEVCHQVQGGDCSTTADAHGTTAVAWVSEPDPNTSIFTGGGSKDPIDISSWAWKN